MRALKRPRSPYKKDLERALNDNERQRFRSSVLIAYEQSKRYAHHSPALHEIVTKLNDKESSVRFLTLYKANRNDVRSIKSKVWDCLDDIGRAYCQYCGISAPDTLDHFLEKAKVPELSLYTRNLIPCCGGCNRDRGKTFDEHGKRRIIHFYDDDVDNYPKMLKAAVTFNVIGDPEVTYSVAQISGQNRALYYAHFGALKLAKRYSIAALAYLQTLRVRSSGQVSEAQLSSELQREADALTKTNGRNDHIAALCLALLSNQPALGWLVQSRNALG